MAPLVWAVVGGVSDGAVVANSTGSAYQAPSSLPAGQVEIRACWSLVPSLFVSLRVTVIAGVTVVAAAMAGTPADTTVASANVGQSITIEIPAATYARTSQGFAINQ